MIVWIAGWPHNGSTLCRQILKESFGINSYSRYLESELEELFPGSVSFSNQWNAQRQRHLYYLEHTDTWFVKTHELPLDNAPAIFVLRDGRDAVCSLSNFWGIPINDAICGMGCIFGTWSSFYYGWDPYNRPNTLVLRLEEMSKTPDIAVKKIAEFIGRKPIKPFDADAVFEESKEKYPYLFNDKTDVWQKRMNQEHLKLFYKCHGQLMKELGYEV